MTNATSIADVKASLAQLDRSVDRLCETTEAKLSQKHADQAVLFRGRRILEAAGSDITVGELRDVLHRIDYALSDVPESRRVAEWLGGIEQDDLSVRSVFRP